jgi:predicted NBD/HSP70 family sugar kinase
LSKPTIAEVLTRLERGGLIVEAGETVGRRGPNGRMHDVVLDRARGAALSVEPSRITCEIVDARGRVLGSASRTRAGLPRGAGAVTRLLVSEAADAAGVPLDSVAELVVGLPGSYDPVLDRVRYADRIPDWTARGIAEALRQEFTRGTDVTIDNDVNLALVAERASGAAGSSAVTSLLWLATGIGLATDLGGTLYRGVSGGAGEIGYIPIPAKVPAGRGRTTHPDFQDVVGGAAVLRLARDHGIVGRSPSAAVERAVADHASDAQASAFLDELASRIALGLAVIVAVLDPGLVVLGGAVGSAGGATLAQRTSRALRAVSPLACQIAASTVAGDPSLAGARAVATDRVRDRLLGAANGPATGPTDDRVPTRPTDSSLPTARTAEEVH